MKLFFKSNLVTTELEPYESNYDISNNAPDPNVQFRAYKPLSHMMNIDLPIEGGLEFLLLLHKTPSHVSTYYGVQVVQHQEQCELLHHEVPASRNSKESVE